MTLSQLKEEVEASFSNAYFKDIDLIAEKVFGLVSQDPTLTIKEEIEEQILEYFQDMKANRKQHYCYYNVLVSHYFSHVPYPIENLFTSEIKDACLDEKHEDQPIQDILHDIVTLANDLIDREL